VGNEGAAVTSGIDDSGCRPLLWIDAFSKEGEPCIDPSSDMEEISLGVVFIVVFFWSFVDGFVAVGLWVAVLLLSLLLLRFVGHDPDETSITSKVH
jgi:hypothetical protein